MFSSSPFDQKPPAPPTPPQADDPTYLTLSQSSPVTKPEHSPAIKEAKILTKKTEADRKRLIRRVLYVTGTVAAIVLTPVLALLLIPQYIHFALMNSPLVQKDYRLLTQTPVVREHRRDPEFAGAQEYLAGNVLFRTPWLAESVEEEYGITTFTFEGNRSLNVRSNTYTPTSLKRPTISRYGSARDIEAVYGRGPAESDLEYINKVLSLRASDLSWRSSPTKLLVDVNMMGVKMGLLEQTGDRVSRIRHPDEDLTFILIDYETDNRQNVIVFDGDTFYSHMSISGVTDAEMQSLLGSIERPNSWDTEEAIEAQRKWAADKPFSQYNLPKKPTHPVAAKASPTAGPFAENGSESEEGVQRGDPAQQDAGANTGADTSVGSVAEDASPLPTPDEAYAEVVLEGVLLARIQDIREEEGNLIVAVRLENRSGQDVIFEPGRIMLHNATSGMPNAAGLRSERYPAGATTVFEALYEDPIPGPYTLRYYDRGTNERIDLGSFE
jgi:hypothetical protein